MHLATRDLVGRQSGLGGQRSDGGVGDRACLCLVQVADQESLEESLGEQAALEGTDVFERDHLASHVMSRQVKTSHVGSSQVKSSQVK